MNSLPEFSAMKNEHSILPNGKGCYTPAARTFNFEKSTSPLETQSLANSYNKLFNGENPYPSEKFITKDFIKDDPEGLEIENSSFEKLEADFLKDDVEICESNNDINFIFRNCSDKGVSNINDENVVPKYTINALIIMALKCSPGGKNTVWGMCKYIRNNFPYYQKIGNMLPLGKILSRNLEQNRFNLFKSKREVLRNGRFHIDKMDVEEFWEINSSGATILIDEVTGQAMRRINCRRIKSSWKNSEATGASDSSMTKSSCSESSNNSEQSIEISPVSPCKSRSSPYSRCSPSSRSLPYSRCSPSPRSSPYLRSSPYTCFPFPPDSGLQPSQCSYFQLPYFPHLRHPSSAPLPQTGNFISPQYFRQQPPPYRNQRPPLNAKIPPKNNLPSNCYPQPPLNGYLRYPPNVNLPPKCYLRPPPDVLSGFQSNILPGPPPNANLRPLPNIQPRSPPNDHAQSFQSTPPPSSVCHQPPSLQIHPHRLVNSLPSSPFVRIQPLQPILPERQKFIPILPHLSACLKSPKPSVPLQPPLMKIQHTDSNSATCMDLQPSCPSHPLDKLVPDEDVEILPNDKPVSGPLPESPVRSHHSLAPKWSQASTSHLSPIQKNSQSEFPAHPVSPDSISDEQSRTGAILSTPTSKSKSPNISVYPPNQTKLRFDPILPFLVLGNQKLKSDSSLSVYKR